jgi:hypothetical protein
VVVSYAIKRAPDEHLGFLLLAGGPEGGDCIFRSLPRRAEDLSADDVERLYGLQLQGEFHWERSGSSLVVVDDDRRAIATIEEGRMIIGEYTFEVEQLPNANGQ